LPSPWPGCNTSRGKRVPPVPKFVFRLDPVLGVRTRKEESARQELASADARKRACEDRLAETRRLLAETLEQNPGSSFDLKTGLYLDCYREYLGRRGTEEVRVLARREKEVEERRARVVEARRARAVLERLKEKQYSHFCAQETARETRELDDAGTRSFQFQQAKKKGGE